MRGAGNAAESRQFVDENTLTVNISRLRRKLDAAGLTDFIATRSALGIWWSKIGKIGNETVFNLFQTAAKGTRETLSDGEVLLYFCRADYSGNQLIR